MNGTDQGSCTQGHKPWQHSDAKEVTLSLQKSEDIFPEIV